MSSTPAQDWIKRLESLFIIDFSSIDLKERLKRRVLWYISMLIHFQMWLRFVLSAFFASSEDWAIYFGSVAYGLGSAFQISMFGAGFFTFCGIVLRWNLTHILRPDLEFIQELLEYDKKKGRTILRGSRRHDFIKTLQVLKVIDKVILPQAMVSLFITVSTVLGWVASKFSRLDIVVIVVYGFWLMAQYAGAFFQIVDQLYPLGFWFMGKKHLDLQADVLIESMTINRIDVFELTSRIQRLTTNYDLLMVRVKRFNQFSRSIISPYRFLMTIGCAVCMSGSMMMKGNSIVTIACWLTVSLYYLTSLTFLSTSSSLSIRRMKMYKLVNSIIVASIHLKVPLQERLHLRKLIKSLGGNRRPLICLTDSKDDELDPIEFVEHVGSFVSMYCLVWELYYKY